MNPPESTRRRGLLERPDTPAQWYALVAGPFLLALGGLSLVLEPVRFGAAGPLGDRPDLLIWSVSGWAAVLWTTGGAIGILASGRLDASRDYALCSGLVFAILAIWGFLDGNDVAGILPAGTANNVTHAMLAGLALLAAGLPRRVQRPDEPAGADAASIVPAPGRSNSSKRSTVPDLRR